MVKLDVGGLETERELERSPSRLAYTSADREYFRHPRDMAICSARHVKDWVVLCHRGRLLRHCRFAGSGRVSAPSLKLDLTTLKE